MRWYHYVLIIIGVLVGILVFGMVTGCIGCDEPIVPPQYEPQAPAVSAEKPVTLSATRIEHENEIKLRVRSYEGEPITFECAKVAVYPQEIEREFNQYTYLLRINHTDGVVLCKAESRFGSAEFHVEFN